VNKKCFVALLTAVLLSGGQIAGEQQIKNAVETAKKITKVTEEDDEIKD